MDELVKMQNTTRPERSDICAHIAQVLVEAIPMPVFCKTEDGCYVDGNRLFFEFIGRDRAEVIGHSVFELFDPEKAEVYDSADQALWQAGGVQEYEGLVDNGDGKISIVRFHKQVITLDSIDQRVMVGIILDVTDLRQTEERLQKAVRTDELTGLYNRKAFMEYLETICLRAQRQKIPFALLMLDLDGFKEVNDQYGHANGDEALKVVAQRFRECVRGSDFVARMGGDEFTIILEDVRAYETCCYVAEKIITTIRQPIPLMDDITVVIGVSIGASLWGKDSSDRDKMLDVADMAMYRAKDMGKGCICYEKACHKF